MTSFWVTNLKQFHRIKYPQLLSYNVFYFRERKDYEITKYTIVGPEKQQIMDHDNAK